MAMTLELSDQPMHPIFIPWCAGASRHERLVQKHVPDSDPGWIPAPARDTNHRRPVNAAGLYQLMRDRSYNGRIIKQLFVLSRAHPDDRANPVLSSTSGRIGSLLKR